MKQDIILAGVGGQGILSIAYVIDNAALNEGLQFKQAEVHGMAQRGGAVQSHLRISDEPVFSDLIPKGKADLLLSVEPLETLRYIDFLSPDGVIVTSCSPHVNIPDYPDLEEVLRIVRKASKSVIVDSKALAEEAGASRAQNMVMLGAASPFLRLSVESLRTHIRALFLSRGEKLVDINLKAFTLGQQSGPSQRK
ncbi:MAG: indolepyruvate oxidoreductase subunit beta [Acidobacteria bacterium]|nr:indolepyruvate oxidoreductase subunit beta [Acidobacteriota bacterium]MBU1339676.1 indolepyruvate oxidoreductase subunit beta [Acidobacteriota bacterium]MBU1474756.1 indolepyruvate oxidoreductase subunit beta [Acidobacteriota bacterium]